LPYPGRGYTTGRLPFIYLRSQINISMLPLYSFAGLIFAAFASAVIGVVYIHVLQFEPVLNWWFRFGMKFERYNNLFRLVWNCEKCVAGQIAFWWYLIGSFFINVSPFSIEIIYYHLGEHLFVITLAIILAMSITALLKRYWII
jgi:hypothetical protein